MKRYWLILCSLTCFFGGLVVPSAQAQTGGMGIVVGRVLNEDTGRYLHQARVTIAGTTRETFTNETGDFVLANVPAGMVTVQASYTGLPQQTISLNIPSDGGRAVADFSLSSGVRPATDKAVVLDAFTVAANREMSASAVAVNEQRTSAAQKSVVAAEDFGAFPDGNMGEFLKFIPGVTIDYAPDPRGVALRGMAGNFTSVTVDGMRSGSASSGNATRAFELEQTSIAAISRAEVVKSRTPDLAADALGGAINLISKSSFDVSKPVINYSAFFNANSRILTTAATPAAYGGLDHKIKPSGSISVIYPVSKTFGFTLSHLANEKYAPYDSGRPFYAPYSQTTPAVGTLANPVIGRWDLQDVVNEFSNTSSSASIDWKFSTYDKLTLSGTYDTFKRSGDNQYYVFNVGSAAPRSYGQTFTEGALGAGSIQIGGNAIGISDKAGDTRGVSLAYDHNGPTWTINGGAKYSRSINLFESTNHGFFDNVLLTLRGAPSNGTFINPTVSFYDMDKGAYLRPGRIEVLNSTGTAPVDFLDINNYNITSAAPNSRRATDTYRTAKLDFSRWLPTRMPVKLKAGALIQDQIRDITQTRAGNYTFVGPDGKANTADDSAGLYHIQNDYIRPRPIYSATPYIIAPDAAKVWNLYVAHPEYFTSTPATLVINNAVNSRFLEETISAGYFMVDFKPIERFRVVGGVRFERTEDYGQGNKQDLTAHYQRDSKGNILRDSANKPLLITTDAYQQALLDYTPRGTKVNQSYDGYYPSLDLTYNLRADLLLRASAARSIGRPDLSLIVPGVTINDTTITAVNAALKPMQTNSFDVSLEYYFKSVGLFSLTGYRKDLSNATASVSQPATLALLQAYSIPDPEQYVTGYTFTTRANGGNAKLTGLEFSYRRSLGFEFLPRWSKDFNFFANGSLNHLKDNGFSEFNGYISRQGSTGLGYIGRRLSANVKINYRGLQRSAPQAYAPGAFDYNMPRTFIDADLEFRLTKWARLFVSGRNLTDSPIDNGRYVAGQPYYNRVRKEETIGTTYVFGVKGTY
jgi:iron complex outermembrane receptor protein